MAGLTGLVTRGFLDATIIRDQPARTMGSISEEVKLFFGRVYDALQICSGKIDAYNQIVLKDLHSLKAIKVNNLFLGIMPQTS